MKISQHNTDDLTATITLNIEKADYEPHVKKSLNEYRRKADIKGFRPGMAPMSLIEKMYGKNALLDEVQKIILENLNKYIEENKLHLLGDPLPNEDERQKINWDAPGDMEFKFDIGIAPNVDLTFTDKDKIPYYKVTVTDGDRNGYTEHMRRKYGNMVDMEEAGEDDFIKATLTQGEHIIEDGYISLKTIQDEALKKPFLGKKVGDEFDVDVKKTFTNETDLAALLKVEKEELAKFEPEFHIKITEVKRFAPAELNQELYDILFGKDEVKSEEEFNGKVNALLANEYAKESEYRFAIDAREEIVKKAQLKLPESFLKRWMLYSNEGKLTAEQIDKDFNSFANDLRWQIICGYLTKTHELKVTEEDLLAHALKIARYQFSMYGIHNAPDEQLEHYAKSILANEKELKRIYEKAEEDKVMAYIKSVVTLDEKEITSEELQKLYETK
ncbi:MAG: trigger factor [Prevotellaceae bacterium]|jgi:trigger factor|nr:trigger factor [Prevotellaceae bacterium]